MEHTSDIVYDGKLLHETSYIRRSERYSELSLSADWGADIQLMGKIDFYDPVSKVIHEVKRSDKAEEAHVWQCKFYIWLFLLNDVKDVHALLEYPRFKHLNEVYLSMDDIKYLEKAAREIGDLLESNDCPAKLNRPVCRSCSYFDMCYIDEI